jgi:hypothetical protein
MQKRKEKQITHSGEKFTVREFSAVQAIEFSTKLKSIEANKNEVQAVDLMIDMILKAVVKPEIKGDDIKELSIDGLSDLWLAVTVGNGFTPAEKKKGGKKAS